MAEDKEREQREQRQARVHKRMLAYERDRQHGTREVQLRPTDVVRLLAHHGRARDAEELERFSEALGDTEDPDKGHQARGKES